MSWNRSRVSELFLRAIELHPTERRRLLDAQTSGVRREVELLLSHADSAPDVLDDPGRLFERLDPPTPEWVGPYEVIERIGAGGMGVVYRARQPPPLGRDVAVKVVRLASHSPQVLARFELECRALAMMDHPNIARILDAGVEEQTPYMVMELADGEPITAYCDRKRLSIDERLELFVRVCAGVEHAHQKAIIHRDIKPSNILVVEGPDGPEPKLIDFGVAKRLDLEPGAGHTEAGQILGTPEYMSPEQTRLTDGEIDTRSDVYSLGVLLFELLTGSLPFEIDFLQRHNVTEICRLINEVDPVRPSTRVSRLAAENESLRARRIARVGLRRRLRGELDWIVLRALEKEPGRRYGSVGELAADVERSRRNEPVVARPPDRLYALRKLVRRHRVAFAVTGAIVLLLLAFAIVTTLQARALAIQSASAERTLDLLGELYAEDDRTVFPLKLRALQSLEEAFADEPTVRARQLARIAWSSPPHHGPVLDELRRSLGDDHPDTLRFMHRIALAPEYEGDSLATLETVYRTRLDNAGPDHLDTLHVQIDFGRQLTLVGEYGRADQLLADGTDRLLATAGPGHPVTVRAEHYLTALRDRQGHHVEAWATYGELLPRMIRVLGHGRVTANGHFNYATASARLGYRDLALEHLVASWDWGFTQVHAGWIEQHEAFASLRGDPRFEAIFSSRRYELLEEAVDAAQRGESAAAIDALERAVDAGFSNAAALRQRPAFAWLVGEPRFQAVLEGLDARQP